MSYSYETERPKLFTEEGQRLFLGVRDRAQALLSEAGAFRLGHAIDKVGGGDAWVLLACIDRLVELDEIVECEANHPDAQDRIFRARRQW